MGIDYARATLPYAVRSINAEQWKGGHELPDTLLDELNEFMEQAGDLNPCNFAGWNFDGDNTGLADSQFYTSHGSAYQLTKDNWVVWLVEEGNRMGGDTYVSVGAETIESLNAFLSDIGLPDASVVERYVFFLIW